MKRVAVTAVVLVLILFLLPFLIVDGPGGEAGEKLLLLPANPAPAGTAETAAGEDGNTVVRVAMEDGEVVEMTMADYLWSVVAAEMPASFEAEALKAQAVTARTYTVWKMEAGEPNHPDADVCTDINCCQAFLSRVGH